MRVKQLRIPRRYAIVEAPSILGLKPTGVDRLPQALLVNRSAERVDANTPGVFSHSVSHERDAATGT